jgi:N-acetyl-anhydromuramyl-L-alanine amidase AmpD
MLKEILINPIDNYTKEENNKKYIILCDTLRNDFDKYILSLKKKEYSPSYVVRKDGTIHKLFDEKYYTDFTTIEKINKASIFIALENSGKLIKENENFLNWCNESINITDVKETNVNSQVTYYESYPKKQIEALGHLIIYLGNKHNLNLKKINTRNKEDNSIILLNQIDVFSNSPNQTLNLEKLNSIIFGN